MKELVIPNERGVDKEKENYRNGSYTRARDLTTRFGPIEMNHLHHVGNALFPPSWVS